MLELKNIKIRKRNNLLVSFDRQKIFSAVKKASVLITENETEAEQISQTVTDLVIKKILSETNGKVIDIESVQDQVETVLMQQEHWQIAKKYILYRYNRNEVRKAKKILGLKDDLKLSLNCMEVLRKRYLQKDSEKNIIETPAELFRRVARHIASAEENYSSQYKRKDIEDIFYEMLANLDFLPNSPTLMNAGTELGQLSACFVLPVEDSIPDIFNAVKQMAIIHQTGGGTGFDFSRIRAKGDLVSSTKGEASGPLSFMEVFDKATEVVIQGGRRRGANMGILRCDHPDIIDFIRAKYNNKFSNFNLSVGITDNFMKAVQNKEKFCLITPKTKKQAGQVNASELFYLISASAWQTGDPGLVFLDEINRGHPLPGLDRIEATNPCGEVPLLPFESCNLGSINLSNMVENSTVDWSKLKKTIVWSIRFLDNVIDINKYPFKQIKKMVQANRKIGLGIMGFADMLIKCNIPYNSKEAHNLADRLMQYIHTESLNASHQLALERGLFPNYEKSVFAKQEYKIRNATVNTIAPTGTLSIIANCSSGIEPLFGVCYLRNVLSGTRMIEVNPIFADLLPFNNQEKDNIYAQILQTGTIQNIKTIPEQIRKLFLTTFDIKPADHLAIQAIFQKYTDNSVSKTINLPQTASKEDVKNIYLDAYRMKCKGITVYRYGSKQNQVLSLQSQTNKNQESESVIVTENGIHSGCKSTCCSV